MPIFCFEKNLCEFVASYLLNSWTVHAKMNPELCYFGVDFNVPGNSNPWLMKLTATVWTLSHYLPTQEREVGETVNFLRRENDKHYDVVIVDKHDDGTYDVFFPDDDLEVERVDPSNFEPFKGTFSACYTTNSIIFNAYLLTHSLSRKICDRVH